MPTRQYVWFGTRGYMQWVPAPSINFDGSKKNWNNQTNYLNGGAFVRSSVGAHKEVNLSWSLNKRDELRKITDFADGVYGTGRLYWTDPFSADKNVLGQHFATPSQGLYDGPILNGATTRGTLVATAANTLGYPAESIQYTVGTVGNTPRTHWIPIPPGYTLWIGAHGVAGTGGVVTATPTTGVSGTGTTVNLTMLSVTSTTRFNQSFDGNTYNGVTVSLGGTGSVTLSGLMAQVLPNGTSPLTGGFISGQGQSGMMLSGPPQVSYYSSVMDLVGVSMNLVEVGAWL